MYVDEVRVRATHAARGARRAIFRRVLVVQFDKALIRSLDALKTGERFRLYTRRL
jgi:hypothetical protein